MSLVVRAFPLRGSVVEFEAFVADLKGSKKTQADEFYQEHGIEHESWHLQQTENGPSVIVVTIVRQVEQAAPKYAQACDDFASWFKGRVLTLSGVDPTLAPLGPPTTEVFRWSGSPALAKAFAA